MPYDPPHQQMGRSVGAKLKEARLAKKYTQSQLAGEDFSVSYISAIERGQIHPSLRALEIFALRLGLSSKDLLAPLSSNWETSVPTRKSPSDEDEIQWQLLTAQVAIQQNNYSQAIRQLQELLTHKLTNSQEIFTHYVLALAYSKSALWQESENAVSVALRLSKDVHNSLYKRLLYLHGIAQSALKDPGESLAYHQRSLEQLVFDQDQDAFFKGELYAQLGLHYLRLEQADEAQAMFSEALDCSDGLTLSQRIDIYWQSTERVAKSGEYWQATLSAYKCLHLLAWEDSQRSRSELFHALGRAMLASQHEETRAYLEQVLDQPTLFQDRQVQASAHINLAAWLLEHDEVAEAKKQAQRGLALLSSEVDSIIEADGHIVLGKSEYAQKRYKAGDSQFAAGFEMLERLDRREDVADNAAHYAQLLENHGDVHRAVLYWKKAFDSRQRIIRPGGE